MVKKGICFLLASGFADKCANVPTWAEWSEWSECVAGCDYPIRRQRCYKNCYPTAIENCEGERPTEQKFCEDFSLCKNKIVISTVFCPSQTSLMRTLRLSCSPYLDKLSQVEILNPTCTFSRARINIDFCHYDIIYEILINLENFITYRLNFTR